MEVLESSAVVEPRLFKQAVVHQTVVHNGVKFMVACFGMNFSGERGIDWSFRHLNSDPLLRPRIGKALRAMGARRALAPNPVPFSAEIIKPAELATVCPLGNSVDLFRNAEKPADVSYLVEAGDAGVFSTGGCPLIVAMNTDGLIMYAHAGRDSVLDRERIHPTVGAPRELRRYASVCDALMSHLATPGVPACDVLVWIYFSIRPEQFRHPFTSHRHADYNRAMSGYVEGRWGRLPAMIVGDAVELDLPELIRAQMLKHGVPYENIVLKHAYLSTGEGAWLDGTPGAGRNLVAVVRQ